MSSFTPGPWEIEDEYVQQAGQPDVGICSVMNMDVGGSKGWYRGSITEANARLIAAAPTLLEALRDMVSDHADLSEATLQFARAAILAAIGDKP